jgi:hypothetical protein
MDSNAADTITMTTNNGESFMISASDLQRVSRHHWYIRTNEAGVPYLYSRIRGREVHLGRFLLRLRSPNRQIDHIDFNTLDYRRENIRPVTRKQQCQHRRVRSDNVTSGFKGVSLDKHVPGGLHRWRAQLWVNNTNMLILRTHSLVEAVCYANIFSAIAFGSFACLSDVSTFL